MEENLAILKSALKHSCSLAIVLKAKISCRSAFDCFQRPVTKKRIFDEQLHCRFDDVAREIKFRV